MAILLVLGYHTAPVSYPGGFVGVDVFFVISGFLITRILIADTAPGRFGRFYARRIRRLAPALVIVLVATLALGHGTLLADAFRQLARHTAAAALFVANIVLWRESGYFDAAAIDKPLLHLWSLGIEEQFYLVWPATLWWLHRRRPGWTLSITTLIAAASFAGCVAAVRVSPAAAFYLPWYRLWEPLAGAILALSLDPTDDEPKPVRSELLAWTGALLVVTSAFFLGGDDPFPSWTALAPVMGTAMLIGAGERTSLARGILSRKPAVGLGKISYPLYLWHWPLISLLANAHPTEGVASRARMCLIAVLLAASTYALAERPVRVGYRRWPRATVGALSGAVILVTAIALVPLAQRASTWLPASPELELLQEAQFLDAELRAGIETRPCTGLGKLAEQYEFLCEVSGPAGLPGPIVLWGDSTAASWAPLVHTVATQQGLGAVVLSFSGCPPLLGVRGPLHDACSLEDSAWKASLIERWRPSHIVLSARWGAYTSPTPGAERADEHFVTTATEGLPDRESSRLAIAETLPETLDWLLGIAPVTVIASLPDLLNELPRALLRGFEYRPSRAAHHERQRLVADLLAEIAEREPRLTVIDPAERLCASGMCTGVLDDTFVYSDDNHVTAQGALLFRELLASTVEQARSDVSDEAPTPGAS